MVCAVRYGALGTPEDINRTSCLRNARPPCHAKVTYEYRSICVRTVYFVPVRYALWISSMTATLILFPGQNVTNYEELAMRRLIMCVAGRT